MTSTIEKTTAETTQSSAPEPATKPNGVSRFSLIMSLLVGIYFGIVLTKSEVVRWQRVHDMFLFKEAHMYLIIGTGIAVAMIAMLIIKSKKVRSIEGAPIVYRPKPFQKGNIIGGTLFGAGWAITGACPGPIFALIGTGIPGHRDGRVRAAQIGREHLVVLRVEAGGDDDGRP